MPNITASIIQGSAIGPVLFVVNAADLKSITPSNELCKYTDDTYLKYQPVTSTSGQLS